jgi:hypothetical protein
MKLGSMESDLNANAKTPNAKIGVRVKTVKKNVCATKITHSIAPDSNSMLSDLTVSLSIFQGAEGETRL